MDLHKFYQASHLLLPSPLLFKIRHERVDPSTNSTIALVINLAKDLFTKTENLVFKRRSNWL